MTVEELYQILKEVRRTHRDKELRFVYQRNYPLQDSIRGVCIPAETGPAPGLDPSLLNYSPPGNDLDEDDNQEEEFDKRAMQFVYIVSDGQDSTMPYGPSAAWDNIDNY